MKIQNNQPRGGWVLWKLNNSKRKRDFGSILPTPPCNKKLQLLGQQDSIQWKLDIEFCNTRIQELPTENLSFQRLHRNASDTDDKLLPCLVKSLVMPKCKGNFREYYCIKN